MRSRFLAPLILVLLLSSVVFAAGAPSSRVPRTTARPGPSISALKPQGVNLRVTDLKIDDAMGYVYASVENVGTPMTKDAKVILYMGNVPIREYVWSKTLNKRTCSKTMLEQTDPAGCRRCEGRSDYKIHFQIVEGQGETHFDNSGTSKEGTLHARQDLAVEYLTADPMGRKSVLIGNRGIADSTTWKCKVYWNNILKQTSALNGAIAAHAFASVPLDPQPPSNVREIKVEIVPTDPLNELDSANNSTKFYMPFNPVSNFDLRVMDIQLYGEAMWQVFAQRPQDCGNEEFYKLIPTIKNISSNKNMPALQLKYETLIDGVSTGEKTYSIGLDAQESLKMGISYAWTSTLPPGTHTVTFRINTNDSFNGNNSLTKVMYRP